MKRQWGQLVDSPPLPWLDEKGSTSHLGDRKAELAQIPELRSGRRKTPIPTDLWQHSHRSLSASGVTVRVSSLACGDSLQRSVDAGQRGGYQVASSP